MRGVVPYADMTHLEEIKIFLYEGKRLKKPDAAPEGL
jgi:hypothetical protein